MVQLHRDFNSAEVEPSTSREPVPPADYVSQIKESEMKDTKAGTGKYLQLVFEIIDGEFKGRMFWVRLNLINNNNQAVEIAERELSAICRAAGILGHVKDSQQLHYKPMMVTLVVERKEGQNPQNTPSKYAALSGADQKVVEQEGLAGPAKPAWAK